MTQLNIPVLLGTGREGRRTEKAARYVQQQALAYGFSSPLLDVRDYVTPFTVHSRDENKKAAPWKKILKEADGLVIVAPEYNHGYPGELKIMLDAAYPEYQNLPVAVCGASAGGLGGARMIENLRPVLLGLQALPLSRTVQFAKIDRLFDEQGNITSAEYETPLKGLFEQLAQLAQALRPLRQIQP